MGESFIESNPSVTSTTGDAPTVEGSAGSATGGAGALGDQPSLTDSPQTATPAPVAKQPKPIEEAPLEPGAPIGDRAPKLADLQDKLCPNCTTGVLEVTRYDPNAIYEQGQGAALAKGAESGGAYDVRCLNCDYTASVAFNPGPLHGGNA